MSLRNTFIRSFGWQALNVMSQVVLQLIFISVLARLISTEAFGIMAIASAQGTANLGKFGALAIFMGLLNDLFMLPALLLTFKPKFKKEIVG